MKLAYRKTRARSWIVFSLAMMAVSCCSCSKLSRRACYPVDGQVLFQGKPATGAIVFFHPTETHDPKDEFFEPTGVVEADGRFRLTTYETEEGAPAGEYLVTVVRRQNGIKGDEELSDTWPQHYESPVTSGLRARVLAGQTQLDPFRLSNAPYVIQGGREMRRER